MKFSKELKTRIDKELEKVQEEQILNGNKEYTQEEVMKELWNKHHDMPFEEAMEKIERAKRKDGNYKRNLNNVLMEINYGVSKV